MARSDTRIVFMGTPDFSVPSLNALIDSGYNVVAAVTQPDRPRGRGHRVSASPVKKAAQLHSVPVIQMDRISSADGTKTIRELGPDYLITAAFGQILSQDLLDVPKRGTVNVHASLLPAYRGASPIVHALMNGETETGITTMYTVREVDAGPVLLQEAVHIGDDETAGQLTERLANLGADVLVRTLDGLADGSIVPVRQNHDEATYFPMLRRGFGEIDWNLPTKEVVNFVRALNPSPGAYFWLGDEKVRVLEASRHDDRCEAEPGTIVCADPRNGFVVAVGDGLVSLDVIQRSGRKAMQAKDSLRGRQVAAGGRLRMRGDAPS